MNAAGSAVSLNTAARTNGSGAAAMLAAGAGCFALAILDIAGEKSVFIRNILNFYKPTGPLSGVTTVAILVWLVTWSMLEWRWRKRTVALRRISVVAFALLGLGLLLTLPPVVDLF